MFLQKVIVNYLFYFLFQKKCLSLQPIMNILGNISQKIKGCFVNLLISIDNKLGGDSSTQSHASNWGNHDD